MWECEGECEGECELATLYVKNVRMWRRMWRRMWACYPVWWRRITGGVKCLDRNAQIVKVTNIRPPMQTNQYSLLFACKTTRRHSTHADLCPHRSMPQLQKWRAKERVPKVYLHFLWVWWPPCPSCLAHCSPCQRTALCTCQLVGSMIIV